MKKIINLLPAFLALISLSSALLLASSAGAIQITNEYWISTNSATANLGTLDQPFDGSTQLKFDAAMNSLPTNSTIHVLAGLYITKGVVMKTGQRILGSGIDVTILQFPPAYANNCPAVISSGSGGLVNAEVCDLTCDCNVLNNTDTYCGVMLDGDHLAVRRVKAIHLGKFGGNSEAWGIALGNSLLPDSTGNIIEDCEITQFDGGGGLSAISMGGTPSNNGISGIMRNNRVILNPLFDGSKGGRFAFNQSWVHDCVIEGNFVDSADVGVYSDTGSSKNVVIANNHFINVDGGVMYTGDWRQNITIANNQVDILNLFGPTNSGAYPFPPVAFYFYPSSASAAFTNIVIIGNTVDNTNYYSSGRWQSVVGGGNITGLLMFENSYDGSMALNFAWGNNSGINIHDNYDLNGNLMAGVGGYTYNDGPFSIGSTLTVSGAISGSTVTATSFSGSGSGLTSLNASSINSGTLPTAQLPLVTPNKGGLGLDASGWAANLIPYTTGTGTFGSTGASSFGLSFLGSANSSAALTSLGLPSNPAAIVTNFSTAPVNFNTNVTASGLLTISNGVASTISNGLPVASLTLAASFRVGTPLWGASWTNPTPENIVVYAQCVKNSFSSSTNIPDNVYYNGSVIFTNVPPNVLMPVFILKPQSVISFTNVVSVSSSFNVLLQWYPF